MRNILLLFPILLALVVASARGEVITREETRDGRKLLVLENKLVRVGVVPDPGGAVVEFIDKRSGTNFVAGADKFLKGSGIFAWKDLYWLTRHWGVKGFMHLPYAAQFKEGPDGSKSIFVTCEAEGLRVEREMRLASDSPELTLKIKLTNTSDKPQRLQVRFHPYCMVGDPYAENSAVVTPLANGEIGKLFVGQGLDMQFITHDGYWLAGNWKTGEGLWMTYRKEQSQCHMTWTDYNFEKKHPMRGAFVAEPFPMPILGQPGQSVEYASTFCPYSAADKPDSIALGVLTDPAEKDRARRFLALVKNNLAAIGPYTMQPRLSTAHGSTNSFSFNNTRRDRMALRPWGICDAMSDPSALQAQPMRCRYYARVFDDWKKPVKLSFRFTATDASGKVAREQVKAFTVDPATARELDTRDDISLAGLPDGVYTLALDVFVEGEQQPIHHHEEKQRLVGQAKPAYERAMAEKKGLQERAFVTALRNVELPKSATGRVVVPIGVEEAGGIARKDWPVRLGVPFAQGALPKEVAVEIVAPDGRKVPAQIEPMSTWTDGSLRWLLVSFPADTPANGHAFYTLRAKPGKPAAEKMIVSETDQKIAVDTGLMKTEWLKAAGGTNNLMFGLLRAEDLWWTDGKGQSYTFRLEGEGAGWSIEENGQNRAVVKAVGWYRNAANRAVGMGELRMEYFRGQKFARLWHTVMFAGDPWKEDLGGYGIRLSLGAGFTDAAVEMDGKVINGPQVTAYQPNSDFCEVTAGKSVTTGRRAAGGVLMQGAQARRVGVYHRDFWRMAPKEVAADSSAGTVSFSYWPLRAGAMSFLPREDGWLSSSSTAANLAIGMSRTHEIVIDLDAAQGPEVAEQVFGEPVIALVPPRYLSATKTMLHISPYDAERYPKLEQYLSNVIDFYDAQRELFGWYGEWYYGGLPNQFVALTWTWRMYGRYACILDESDIVQGPWLCYLRSGDRKYLKFAESNTRQLMEVGTIRSHPMFPDAVGLSRRHFECLWMGDGDTGHSMLDPFVEYWHAVGYRPAWEAAQRMAGAMTKVSTGTWRYISNPTAGLARMYLETQNPLYKEHADRIWKTLCYPEKNDWFGGDHGNRMMMWYSQLNPECKAFLKEWALNPEKKGRFADSDVLTALYLETGDARYAEAVRKIPLQNPMEDLTTTQNILGRLRASCYAGEALAGEPPAAPAGTKAAIAPPAK